jgi:hypothetical protein
MIKMEVDNVTEIVPQDDFEFQMNVSDSTLSSRWKVKEVLNINTCRSNAVHAVNSTRMQLR